MRNEHSYWGWGPYEIHCSLGVGPSHGGLTMLGRIYVNSAQAIFELTLMWLGMWCVGHYKRVLAIFGVDLSTTTILKMHNMSLIYSKNNNLGYIVTTTNMIDLDEIS